MHNYSLKGGLTNKVKIVSTVKQKFSEMKNDKQGVKALGGLAMEIVFGTLVIAAGLLVLGNFRTAMTAGSSEANATGSGITAVASLTTTWLPAIVSIAVVGVIFYYLYSSFGGKKR